jgi:hypothetical protein
MTSSAGFLEWPVGGHLVRSQVRKQSAAALARDDVALTINKKAPAGAFSKVT